jgi:hypothetical protein
MGRSSRACSVLGSALLLLLLSLGSAAAQKGSTWKTLSGKLDSLRLTSFLASSAACAYLICRSGPICCYPSLKDQFFSWKLQIWFCHAVWAGSLGREQVGCAFFFSIGAQASIFLK